MANIKPITSEEVLARQVKETAEAAAEQPQPSTTSPVEPQNAASSIERESSVSAPLASKRKQNDSGAGFYYRLPLGVYILAYNYFLIAVITFCLASLSTVLMLQTDSSSIIIARLGEALEEYRSTWLVSLAAFVAFVLLLSARSFARWIVILGSAGGAVYVAMQLASIYTRTAEISSLSTLGSNGMMTTMLVGLLPFIAVLLLVLSTFFYLLRPKISAIYE